MSSKDATFYLQLDPTWSRWATTTVDGERVPDLESITAVRITQKRPAKQLSGTVLVKLTVRVPETAFRPLRPAAVVVIPEDMTQAEPIEVIAEDLANA